MLDISNDTFVTQQDVNIYNLSQNMTEQSYDCYGDEDRKATSPTGEFIINGVIVPTIGALGILGNLLNLGILSWRSWRKDDDTLEKVALVGLISLAVSDMCFCITVVPGFVCWDPLSYDDTKSFQLLYQAYGGYFKNVFIKTSTWLTMIVASARYVAICHPLRARMCFGLTPTKIAIIFTYVFWAVLSLPLLWEFKIIEFAPHNITEAYVLDFGPFSMENQAFKTTWNYVYAVLGYFIPISILAFCNVCLIRALRESRLLRETVATRSIKTSATRQGNHRITLTLVMLVLMFFLLVSPSELLHFVNQVTPEYVTVYELGILFTNVLQAVNFAFHFVLYVVVNVTFRRSLVNMGFYCLAVIQTSRFNRQAKGRESFSRRSTFAHSALRSNETHI